MKERQKLEEAEGKQHDEAGVSDRMKTLNKRFGITHGCSSLINMAMILSLITYPFM